MAKFKVGEEAVVAHGKSANMILHITDIKEITCSGGTQVFYVGRVWQDAPDYKATKQRVCFTKSTEFSENELEAK